MRCKFVLAISCIILLSGCAEVIEGDSQEVSINTSPEGASCSVMRNGVALGTVSPTPGKLRVDKTKDDLSINCTKKGYESSSFVVDSGHPKNNWLYILVGGPIGWGYDSAVGADNYYRTPINIELSKK